MNTNKKLAPGELRFIAKLFDAKKKIWGIYDKARGSWPVRSPELGEVKQDLKLELEAAEEAERLNAEHSVGGATAVAVQAVQAAVVVEEFAAPVLATPVPDLPDYGVMSEDERKKYEEGLF